MPYFFENTAGLIQAAQELVETTREFTEATRKAVARKRRRQLGLSDQDVRSLAIRAVLQFNDLPAQEAEHAWRVWKEELNLRYPDDAAKEISDCAEELRKALK